MFSSIFTKWPNKSEQLQADIFFFFFPILFVAHLKSRPFTGSILIFSEVHGHKAGKTEHIIWFLRLKVTKLLWY